MKITSELLMALSYKVGQSFGRKLDSYELKEIESKNISELTIEEIVVELCQFIENQPTAEDDLRSTAYWVLGGCGSEKLVIFYRKWLDYEIKNNNDHSIYQIMIALDNIGEPVFGGRLECSALDDVQNKKDAICYLSDNGSRVH